MAEKHEFNNPGLPNQPIQNYGFQPPPVNSQSNGFHQPPVNSQSYGFQPPPAYDQSFSNTTQQQQQQYHAPQQLPQVVTVITAGNTLGPDSTTMTCPSCRNLISTRVEHESSSKTHLFALLLCLLVWPCFWIPYAVDSCKNATHYCPSCNSYLGAYAP